jgi:hypothetical protein
MTLLEKIILPKNLENAFNILSKQIDAPMCMVKFIGTLKKVLCKNCHYRHCWGVLE